MRGSGGVGILVDCDREVGFRGRGRKEGRGGEGWVLLPLGLWMGE